jgi:uncharacterized protein (UPF0332 family)
MMAKAEKACSAARLLLEHGYLDDAINRAYYAMFDAARAALLAVDAPVDVEQMRTHHGLIGSFGNYLVKNGPVPKELGRLLAQTFSTRLMADYTGNSVEQKQAHQVVEHAETFIAAIRDQFMPD